MRGQAPVPEEMKLAVRRLRREGVTVKELCRLCNRSESVMYRWLSPDLEKRYRQDLKDSYKKNPKRYKAYVDKYRKSDKGKAASSRFETSDKRRAYKARQRATADGLANGRNRQGIRRLKKTNTPEHVLIDGTWIEVDRKLTYELWGELLLPIDERNAIREICKSAQVRTERTGIEYHVDHIQPLSKGGEHAAFNLQILTAEENLSKGNDFRIEDQALLAKRLFNIQ